MSKLIEVAKGIISQFEEHGERALKSVPKEYHEFMIFIEEHKRISGSTQLTDEEREFGIWSGNNGTFITVLTPYLQVHGRVQWARDDHKEQKAKLHIHPPEISLNGRSMTVVVESELYGTSSGIATINAGINGYDDVNPLESAQTSCIGRALGFLGYGLIGQGIASAEEVEKARKARLELRSNETPTTAQEQPPVNEIAATREKKGTADGTENPSLQFRIKALSDAQINKDGTVFFEAMNIHKATIQVLAPKKLNTQAKNVMKNHVLLVNGWMNESVLKLDPTSEIKLATSNSSSSNRKTS